eukprot:gene1412-1635_t
MVLLHFKRHGHSPVALLGGATALIGDPSGKSTDRPQLDSSFVVENSSHIADIGRHFRVGSMLRKDFVHNRLGSLVDVPNSESGKTSKHLILNDADASSGISLPEFCYSLFQANDYVHLNQTHGCVIQIGGSDQWGNITDGCDLIKRKLNKSAFGITIPLLLNAQGKKLGKSEGNSIWLSAQRTSPFNFYQYFIQVADEDIEKLLKLFTFIPLEEVTDIVEKHRKEPHLRVGQRMIAEHVTELVHGKKGVEEAVNTTNLLFGDNKISMKDNEQEIGYLLSRVNSVPLSLAEHVQGDKPTPIVNIFCQVSGMSKNQAKLLVSNQSLYLNGEPIKQGQTFKAEDLVCNSYAFIRQGKKAYYLIKFT